MADHAHSAGPDAEAPLIAEGLFSFQIGGSERVGANVALECVRRGYRVVCFAFYDSAGPLRRELEAGGVECVELSYLSRKRYIRRLTYQLALFRFFRHRRVHAVHIHHATSLTLGGPAARCARVKRVIMTEHSIIEFQTSPKYRRQSRRFLRFAHAISVIHASMEPYFRSVLHVPASRLHYIPNGVRLGAKDSVARARLRQSLGIAEEQFLWMFAGRLAPVKDLGTLIKALASASGRSAAPLRLAIVGDGPERAALERLSRSLGLDAVILFLGARTDVPPLMQAADGFVMSSLSEGLPMVLLEAMAARIPCVATSVGGIPELFSGGAGLLAPPQDALGLADALLQLVADPERRHRMAQAGFAKVAASNDLDRVVDDYLRLFELPTRWPPRQAVQPLVVDAT